jgi:hypothetical protein
MIATYAAVFFAYLVYVFFRAFQQLNVMHHRMLWIMPVSLMMGLIDVFVMGTIAVVAVDIGRGWQLMGVGISMGLGGAVGAIVAMLVHRRLR